MKIAFLSLLDPDDIHNWSGTLYYIYHSLKRDNEVMWIGKDVRCFSSIIIPFINSVMQI